MGRINTGRLGLKSDKHRGPTALGVYFFKPRPTGIYSTHYIPPRNVLFLKYDGGLRTNSLVEVITYPFAACICII